MHGLGPRRALRYGVLSGLTSLGVAHLLLTLSYTMDDAYITYRYARNLSWGLGAVYNPGEYVKGYSSSLYAFLMVLPHYGSIDVDLFSKALGAAAFLGVLALILRTERGTSSRPVIAGLFWVTCAPAAVWSVAGMETGFYAFLVTAGVLLRLREQGAEDDRHLPLSALLFAAIVLTRPEGIVIFFAMACHSALLIAVRRKVHRLDLAWFAIPAATYGLELWASTLYYGDPYPQTFHAKVRGSSPWSAIGTTLSSTAAQLTRGYVAKWAASSGGPVIWLCFLALLRRERFRSSSAYALVVLAQVAFIGRVGGDWMPAYRFMVPVCPLIALLFAEAVEGAANLAVRAIRRANSPTRLRVLAEGALSLGYFAMTVPANYRISQRVADAAPVDAASKLREGQRFADLMDPGRVLVSFDIGGHGYASNMHIIDTGGLVSRNMVRCYSETNRPRCREAAFAMRPDFVRRHQRSGHESFIAKPMLKSGAYLLLKPDRNTRYLIRRELIFPPWVPGDARAVARPPRANDSRAVAAVRMPSVVVTGQQFRAELIWNFSSVGFVDDRRVVAKAAGQQHDLHASTPIWSLLSRAGWPPTAPYVADPMRLKAPTAAGRYAVAVEQKGRRSAFPWTLTVVSKSEAQEHAHRLASEAAHLCEARSYDAAIALFRNAALLSKDRATVQTYQACVVRYARELVARDDRNAWHDARFIMMRAVVDGEQATDPLRRSLDDVVERLQS